MTQLALVIDLNVCVGCHACVTSCKQWNTSGAAGSLTDENTYDKDPSRVPAINVKRMALCWLITTNA